MKCHECGQEVSAEQQERAWAERFKREYMGRRNWVEVNCPHCPHGAVAIIYELGDRPEIVTLVGMAHADLRAREPLVSHTVCGEFESKGVEVIRIPPSNVLPVCLGVRPRSTKPTTAAIKSGDLIGEGEEKS